jgi:uncharacterized protein (TIGR02147 family)
MKQIFEYNNYRLFLKDYFSEKKRTTGYFTHRYFAEKARFSSPVFIKLVIDGKANLSKKSIKKLIPAMELTDIQARYFDALVNFNQAKTHQTKQKYFAILRAINKDHSVHVLDTDQYDFYSNWHNSAIRELAAATGFKNNFADLGKQVNPPLKTKEAKAAIRLLEKANLLKKKDDGTYEQTTKIISTGSEVVSLAVRALHRQMAQLAVEAIENVPKDERDISGLTVGVSQNGFEKIKEEIKKARERIMSIVAEDEPVEKVCRVNFHLFPISKNISSGNDKESG